MKRTDYIQLMDILATHYFNRTYYAIDAVDGRKRISTHQEHWLINNWSHICSKFPKSRDESIFKKRWSLRMRILQPLESLIG